MALARTRMMVSVVAAAVVLAGCSLVPGLQTTNSEATTSPSTETTPPDPPPPPPPEPDPTTESEPSPTWPDTIETVSTGVVILEHYSCAGDLNGAGTGFLVGPDLVVTAAHVVDDVGTVSAIVGEGMYETTVLGLDEVDDVALLRTTEELPGHVFELIDEDPRLAEEVTALGYPLWSTSLKVTSGTVSATGLELEWAGGNQWPVTQTDTAVNHGNSGGPLILIDGDVAGVVISRERDREDGRVEGVGYALSGTEVRGWVEDWLAPGAAAPQRESCEDETPSDSQLEVTVAVDGWQADVGAILLERYAVAINTGDWDVAWGSYTPAMQGRISDREEWVAGLWTTY